jgi:hypothetical protein
MNESFETTQKLCPQCGEVTDADARFCKNCAFDLANSDVNHKDSTEVKQTRIKGNTLAILGALCLLVFVVVGLVIKLTTGKTNQPVVENGNSVAQAPTSIITLSEKGQQIEGKILRGEALNSSDLEGFSTAELRILRNVHFARYGRKYERPGLGDYFYTRSWYKSNDAFNDSMLTSIDKENITMILSVEKPEVAQSTPINPSAEDEIELEEEVQLSPLYSEAQKLAETFWKKNLAKCGDSYYWEMEQFNLGIQQVLYECKGEPSIFAEGEEFQPRLLTEAEKLNGVDPLPEEWKGNATVSFTACRYVWKYKEQPPKNTPWREWKDNVSHKMKLWKSKGKWFLPNIPPTQEGSTGMFIKPVQCSNLPRF